MKKAGRVIKSIWKDIRTYWPGILILAVYIIVTDILFGTMCPIALLTGFPCPGCGLTRSLGLVCTLHFREAFLFHACIYLWIAMAVYFVIRRYFLEKKGFPVAIFVAVCAVTVVYYAWRMFAFYPGDEPLVYRERNLLGQILGAFAHAKRN